MIFSVCIVVMLHYVFYVYTVLVILKLVSVSHYTNYSVCVRTHPLFTFADAQSNKGILYYILSNNLL